MRFKFGPILTAAVVIGVAGGVHGVQTDRWGSSAQLERARARLDHLPATVDDWRGTDVPFEAEDMLRVGIKGCVQRDFQNPRTRAAVSILVVCGRGGPISVHTPDICYAGAGYRQSGDAQPKTVEYGEGRKGTFRAARFTKPGVVPVQLEIYWAWSRDGRTWEAPDNPRLSLARLPALYKMYAVRRFTAGSREETADTCGDFLRPALPEFDKALALSD